MKQMQPLHTVLTAPSPRATIVGTGLLTLDVVIGHERSAQRLWAGGTCGNVLTILSYLGWDAYPVSRLNGDVAAEHVVRDLRRWKVHLDFARLPPGGSTPIIVHQIGRTKQGEAFHRFSWTCPQCGAWLPPYKAALANAVKDVLTRIHEPSVFFFDRLSRGALMLAKDCAAKGALVVFEPVGIGNPDLFAEAIATTHVLKYASDRAKAFRDELKEVHPLLEIETLGREGLRYRSNSGPSKTKGWEYLPSFRVAQLKDAGGAGDWFTAGFLHLAAQKGFSGFRKLSGKQLREAFRVAEAMAAWTCGFEGARGGMYKTKADELSTEIVKILSKESVTAKTTKSRVIKATSGAKRICPACKSRPEKATL